MAISVTYSEMQGSPTEGLTRAGIKTATRKLECAWTDRWTLMAELLDEEYENESGTLMKNTSNTCAPIPAANTGATTVAAYEKAIITASYSILSVTLEEDEAGEEKSERIEPVAEFLTIGVTNLKWTGAAGRAVEADEAPGKLFVGFDYVFTKTFQDDLPASVLDLIGTVNAGAVHPTSAGMETWTFAAETLLYQPPTIQRTINSIGELTWTVQYRFTYKPNWDGANARGWNYYWNQKRAASAGFDLLWDVDNAAQYKQYPTGDFTLV